MTDAVEYSARLPVDPDHPVFAGHFPGRPIVPGVLLIDWALAAIQERVPGTLLFGELGTVKFLHPVKPGAELLLVFSVADGAAASKKIALRIECGEQLVASATLTASMADHAGTTGE